MAIRCRTLHPTHQFIRRFHVRPLQPRHNRRPQIHTLDHRYEALGYRIASNNAPEDVDEDGCDFGIAGDEVECLLDGLWSCSTANVKEVRRLSAVQLDDVHGGHRQTSTVD